MRSWRVPLLAAGLVVLTACSDTEPKPPTDDQPPEAVILFPIETFDRLHRVQDQTPIYVGATDPSGIAEVVVYFQRPADTEATEIARVDEPTPLAEVPDSLRADIDLPLGWSLYQVDWSSQVVRSGLEPQIFAEAFDTAGNRAVSPTVTVEVINTTDLEPPVADFLVNPPIGDTNTNFSFDPSLTTDRVDDPAVVRVRWDFDGDGAWDLGNWDASGEPAVFADEVQSHRYLLPNTYSARMQAKNTYFPGESTIRIRVLNVTAIGGEPDPPVTMAGEFVTIPAGVYTRGPADPTGVGQNELPAHRVTLTVPYRILSREVTNQEYLNFLNEAGDSLQVTFLNDEVYSTETPPKRLMRLADSRIFFNIDADGYQIEPSYEDHPVLGVTWYGATAFAVFYGLRLPTEAEWEVAAKGDSTFFRYSHGRTLQDGDPTGQRRLNYENSGDPFEGNRGTTPVKFYDGRTVNGFTTIDTGYEFPGAGQKIYDMAGNAAEWVNDWYAPYEGDQTNPQGPATGDLYGNFKVIRGGSFEKSAVACRVTAREADRPPDAAFPSVGFRVAYFPVNGEGLRTPGR